MIYLQREEFDAIVVGSGISGGWAAKELTEKGLKTLVLERGRNVEHGQYPTEHRPSWNFPLRERRLTPEQEPKHPIQGDCSAFREATKHFFIEDAKNPYVQAKPFQWVQGDQVGGKSLLWGRGCYRMSDLDFTANLQDGHGVDWPIRYADLAPWYSYVERFAGISGKREGIAHFPDGEFQPEMEMNAGEKFVKAGLERAYPDRILAHGRFAVLTRAIGDRQPCHYCGPCERGCSTGSYFSSLSSTLPAARATGNLTLRPHSLAHSVIFDEQRDRASGVRFVDTQTGEVHEVFAKVIFLCASTIASTRMLLNSKSPRHPRGLGANNGVLGRYLMDHHMSLGARGEVPGLLDRYYQGNRPTGVIVPRFRNVKGPASDGLPFVRGYHCAGGAGRSSWGRGAGRPEIGAELKKVLHDPGAWSMSLGPQGECLPYDDNFMELAEQTDPWGIPVPRISAYWHENEMRMREDMKAQAAEMLEAAGCKNVRMFDNLPQLTAMPGSGIHEMGTARMGRDPKTSVLNAYNRMWDAPNVFVTDGACMTSAGNQNPSITYMALTARAA
ncbi:MAG: GMC family oxidoreductase, partial [Gemmatimonadetes bacterium]|nr:GMC family oxidoreductase [Gemmatimonadota bacterium]